MRDTAAHRVTRWVLRLIVIGYLLFLVIWPVALVAAKTFANGLAPVIHALRQVRTRLEADDELRALVGELSSSLAPNPIEPVIDRDRTD